MKYAISSTGNTLESRCDSHFARSPYFALFNSQHNKITFIENPYQNLPEKAGPSVVKMLSSHNIEAVVSSELGEKIKNHFQREKIGMVILEEENKSIKEIIDIINNKKEE